MKNTSYDDTVKITCTDNGRIVDGDILNFKQQHYIDVSLNKSLKIHLNYNEKQKIYIGSMAGLEFTTTGPKKK